MTQGTYFFEISLAPKGMKIIMASNRIMAKRDISIVFPIKSLTSVGRVNGTKREERINIDVTKAVFPDNIFEMKGATTPVEIPDSRSTGSA
jgi:hypothetical protein